MRPGARPAGRAPRGARVPERRAREGPRLRGPAGRVVRHAERGHLPRVRANDRDHPDEPVPRLVPVPGVPAPRAGAGPGPVDGQARRAAPAARRDDAVPDRHPGTACPPVRLPAAGCAVPANRPGRNALRDAKRQPAEAPDRCRRQVAGTATLRTGTAPRSSSCLPSQARPHGQDSLRGPECAPAPRTSYRSARA